MKATIETSLVEPCNVAGNDTARILLDRLFSKVKSFFRVTVLLGKGAVTESAIKLQSHKAESGLFVAFMRYQQRKARLVEQDVKDEFYFRRHIRRRNIPRRTWNRHSAFLYYSQQKINEQKLHQHAELEQLRDTAVEKSVEFVGRMSFQVKSIKPLPVWATAFHELSWIESDLSSLRLMEFQRIDSPTAEAA